MRVLPTRMRLPVSFALLLVAGAGMAEDAPGKLRAQVESAQAGDIACYLQLSDGRSLMADFALCDERMPPHKQTIWLLSEQSRVAAASCEGDPECRDTETVELVVDWQSEQSASAVCEPGSNPVFSCSTGRKRVALCQRPDGQLWYRFGVDLDAPEKSLTVPASAAERVEGATQTYAGGGAAWLRLREGRHAYVLYSGIGRWGEHGEPQAREGIGVERDGKAIAQISCTDTAISELGPDWFEQHRVRAADPDDFELPL